MDRRLVVLALATPLAVLLASRVPPALLVAQVLIPATAIAWAVRCGVRSWALAMIPGLAVMALVMGDGLTAFLCGALSGPLVAGALRRGASPLGALAWGSAPFVARTLGLASTGFQPFGPELGEALDEVFRDAARTGEAPVESLSELRASFERMLAVLGRIWVATESLWFWGSLVLAYAALRRIFREGGFAPFGRFLRFDLRDVTVWICIAGLAAVLAGGSEGRIGTIGWNLVVVTGTLFFLRGLAIEAFWMERYQVRRPVRALVFTGAVLFLLPVFVLASSSLGLFDAWFDFRKIRSSDGASDPFAFLRQSSPDDVKKKE